MRPMSVSFRAAHRDEIRHATTVAVAGRGVMIVGPSASGKSSLALTLMALGADLVADDRTRLTVGTAPGRVWADAPAGLPQLIEARGVGLLPAPCTGPVPLVAVADLDRAEASRLPPRRSVSVLGCDIALFHAAGNAHFAYAIHHWLKQGAAAEVCDER